MVQIRNKKELKPVRSKLRGNMPAPELILWKKIRNNALGLKFRRQFSILNYILDFYSPTAKLAIEVDGDSHFENYQSRRKDEARDFQLARLGIKVLRFANHEIIENLEGVISKILEKIPPLSLPLSAYGGQGEKVIH